MLKLTRIAGPVWINPFAAQSVEPNANGEGCFVALTDGRGFHVTNGPDYVACRIAEMTNRELALV